MNNETTQANMTKFTLWRAKYTKLRLYWLWDFLLQNRDFFIKSDFGIVINVHTPSDMGVGNYLLHKDLWKFFARTDDHDLRYETMEKCYADMDKLESIELNAIDKQGLLKPKWHIVMDCLTEQYVGLVGEHEKSKIVVNETCYPISELPKLMEFIDTVHDRHEWAKVYIDLNNPLFIDGIEYARPRYKTYPITLPDAIVWLNS